MLENYKAYNKPIRNLFRKTVNEVYMGLFVVQTDPVKRGIALKALQMAEILLAQILADNMDEMNEVCMRFEQINSRAMEKPKESHEMKALKAYLEGVGKEQIEAVMYLCYTHEILPAHCYSTRMVTIPKPGKSLWVLTTMRGANTYWVHARTENAEDKQPESFYRPQFFEHLCR